MVIATAAYEYVHIMYNLTWVWTFIVAFIERQSLKTGQITLRRHLKDTLNTDARPSTQASLYTT